MCIRLDAQRAGQNSTATDKPVYNNLATQYHVLLSGCEDFQLWLQNIIINSGKETPGYKITEFKVTTREKVTGFYEKLKETCRENLDYKPVNKYVIFTLR
jgi:hypothetical protein